MSTSTAPGRSPGKGNSLKKLLGDKRNLAAAVGVVAVAGVAVWYRNRQAAGGGGAGGGQAAAAGGYPAQFDSTGTDLGAVLANYQAAEQSLLSQWQTTLSGLPPASSGGTGPVGPAVFPPYRGHPSLNSGATLPILIRRDPIPVSGIHKRV